jgi:CO/xanthine dehydrogenase Mo-binding subunit
MVRAADTDAAGNDVGVGGGRTTVALGAAGLAAAQEVYNKLLKVASEMIAAAPDDLVMRNGRIEIAGAPGSGRSITEVATHAQAQFGPIAGTGAFTRSGVRAYRPCRDASPVISSTQSTSPSSLFATALDVVPVEPSLYGGAPSMGPLGTKGAGEVPILNVGATLACAVANATGKRVRQRR